MEEVAPRVAQHRLERGKAQGLLGRGIEQMFDPGRIECLGALIPVPAPPVSRLRRRRRSRRRPSPGCRDAPRRGNCRGPARPLPRAGSRAVRHRG
ncbi:MAG: hypothetical protein MZU79_01220 [Anaerotruncus sp.]|nr:hypothetical protein [Anaerotruncus sp.]